MAEHIKQLIKEANYIKCQKDDYEILYGMIIGRQHGLELVKKNGVTVSIAVYNYGECIFKVKDNDIMPDHIWLTRYNI